MKARLVYFAWVRERIGKGEEEIDLPASVVTVGDLLNHLKTLGEEYEIASGDLWPITAGMPHLRSRDRRAGSLAFKRCVTCKKYRVRYRIAEHICCPSVPEETQI